MGLICKKCHKEFKPDNPSVIQLMAIGSIETICDECSEAPKTESLSKPVKTPAPVSAPKEVLRRLDWYNSEGRIIRFMALPIIRLRDDDRTSLRRPRVDDRKVFIISEHKHNLSTTAPIRIVCNIHTFEKQRVKFRARKTPSGWDAATGIDRIDVGFNNIDHVEREFGKTTVYLKNGEKIVGTFS